MRRAHPLTQGGCYYSYVVRKAHPLTQVVLTMPSLETDALVLRTYNFGEADKIVVCLTRGAGLIRGVAKGCRKLKSRFGAALEPFTVARLTYYQKENQELVSLSQAEIVKSHFDL